MTGEDDVTRAEALEFNDAVKRLKIRIGYESVYGEEQPTAVQGGAN